MPLNLVVIDGIVSSLALRYGADGKPELRFVLGQRQEAWSLYVPCCAVGATAERLAAELEDGQHLVITSGKLCYRKRTGKLGEASRMEILVWALERFTESPQDARSAPDASNAPSPREIVAPEGESATMSPTKSRPRYPRWKAQPTEPN